MHAKKQFSISGVEFEADKTPLAGTEEVKIEDGTIPSFAKPSRFNVFIPLRNERTLVYNSRSSALALWAAADMILYENVKRGKVKYSDLSIWEMSAGGYVVSERFDEMMAVSEFYHQIRFKSECSLITVAPTMACNFNCDYCFQGHERNARKMSPDVQDALVKYLETQITLDHIKYLRVNWYGGEPLIAKDIIYRLWSRIVSMCEQYQKKASGFIVTNGYLLDVVTARRLKECAIDVVQVTIDGPALLHDQRRPLTSGKPTYNRILDNIAKVLFDVPIQINMRVNIDSRNKDHIITLLDDLCTRGLNKHKNFHVYFAPVEAVTLNCHRCNEVTMTKYEYSMLETKLLHEAYDRGLVPLPRPMRYAGNCQAGRPGGIVVLPDGELHKCWDTVSETALSVGNIFSFDEVKKNTEYQKWLTWSALNYDFCQSCPILPCCMGFCAYKFIYHHKISGEAGIIPCHSWKFNLHERLFMRAEKMGFVSTDDWDDKKSSTPVSISSKWIPA